VTHENHLHWGEDCIQEGLARQATWYEIIQDLVDGGCSENEVAMLLRQRDLWVTEAREMKAEGYPYDDILYELTTVLKATWTDVARVLMEVGVTPADTLRLVLPLMEGDDYWAVVQPAMMDGPEDADYDEVCNVVSFFLSEEAAFGKLELSEVVKQKNSLRQKLQELSQPD
jgi:hypothetical protein